MELLADENVETEWNRHFETTDTMSFE